MKNELTDKELQQFLADVHTAAGLVSHGRQCKALGDRLSVGCMALYAMIAENARLRVVPMKYRRMAFNAQLQKENDALKAENEALRFAIIPAAVRTDAERYRWLSLQDLTYLSLGYIVDREHDGEYCVDLLDDTFYGETLGAAIDKAMAKAEQS